MKLTYTGGLPVIQTESKLLWLLIEASPSREEPDISLSDVNSEASQGVLFFQMATLPRGLMFEVLAPYSGGLLVIRRLKVSDPFESLLKISFTLPVTQTVSF